MNTTYSHRQFTRLCFVLVILLSLLSPDSYPTATVLAQTDSSKLQSELGPNIVVNGSFETPTVRSTTFDTYRAGQTFGGWTVASGSIDHISKNYWQASDGLQSVDVTGSPGNATIYQELPTLPQKTYELSFDLSGNPEGSPQIKQVEVWWGSVPLGAVTYDTTGNSKSNMNWSHLTYSVTATSDNTRLTFKSLISGYYGPVIDNVRVQDTVTDIPVDYSGQQWYLRKIGVLDAWKSPNYRGSSDIVVAILDTGVDYTVADLDQNMWTNVDENPSDGIDNDNNGYIDDYRGWDFTTSIGDNDPKPESNGGKWGHGTAVAGIIGADHGDGGVEGINWHVKLMPIRVMKGDDESSFAGCGEFFGVPGGRQRFANGIDYAVENKANIITISTGFAELNFPGQDCLDKAIARAKAANVLIVAASGNEDQSSAVYPASSNYVIAVGATDEHDHRLNRVIDGIIYSSNYGNALDVVAPGWDFPVLQPGTNQYILHGAGTSFSAPQVAGVAALIMAANPALIAQPQQVRALIEGYAEKVGGYPYQNGFHPEMGWGRINAYKALIAAAPPACPQSGGVILYFNANYDCSDQGENNGYVLRNNEGWQNITGGMNENASSVRIPAGWSVKLYADPDKSGASECFSGLVNDFAERVFTGTNIGINDQVSSIEVFLNGNCSSGTSLFEDQFTTSTLDPRWHWIGENPYKWNLGASPGNLQIIATRGDLRGSCNNAQNLLLQDAPSGDFEISTKVSFNPTANYQQGGLLIFGDNNNYIKIAALWNSSVQGGQNVEFLQEQNGVFPSGWPRTRINLSQPAFLKISKSGNLYTGLYSADGQQWTILGSLTGASTIVNPEIGLYGFTSATCFASASTPDIAVNFDFFRVNTEVRGADVAIGGIYRGRFEIPPHGSLRAGFVGVNNGPVKLMNTHSSSMIAAERVIYKVNNIPTSFSEMMGLPNSQLDTTYWLPWYNNLGLDTQLRIANVTGAAATVRIYIAGQEKTSGCTPSNSPYTLAVGASLRISCAGVNNGPVKIESTQNIVAAERVIYKVNNVNTSFSELMALPNSQLDKFYWLPWYNSKTLDTELRIANTTNVAGTVRITIGGTEMGTGFPLPAGGTLRKSFPGINNGPVKIESDVNIVAAERVIYKVNGVNTSFTEMMALPDNQLDTTYWLPWYNNLGLDTQLRLANVGNLPTTVHVYIGGTERGTGYPLDPGESTRLDFAGVNAGPVQIVATQNIVVAQRMIYKLDNLPTSFTEMMGLPDSQLDNIYWLPWYNNIGLDTQLRFAVP